MTAPGAAGDVTLERLEDQLSWYDRSSSRAQRNFKTLKTITLVLAAAVPLSAAFGAPSWVAAVLGFGILVAEGLVQLNQYQVNWQTYRTTAEALKHEKYLYLAAAGPYREAEDPKRLLAERIEELVSQEHARWVASHEEARKKATTSQTREAGANE